MAPKVPLFSQLLLRFVAVGQGAESEAEIETEEGETAERGGA